MPRAQLAPIFWFTHKHSINPAASAACSLKCLFVRRENKAAIHSRRRSSVFYSFVSSMVNVAVSEVIDSYYVIDTIHQELSLVC